MTKTLKRVLIFNFPSTTADQMGRKGSMYFPFNNNSTFPINLKLCHPGMIWPICYTLSKKMFIRFCVKCALVTVLLLVTSQCCEWQININWHISSLILQLLFSDMSWDVIEVRYKISCTFSSIGHFDCLLSEALYWTIRDQDKYDSVIALEKP